MRSDERICIRFLCKPIAKKTCLNQLQMNELLHISVKFSFCINGNYLNLFVYGPTKIHGGIQLLNC